MQGNVRVCDAGHIEASVLRVMRCNMMTALMAVAALATVASASSGLSDHAVVGTGPSVLLSGVHGTADWTLTAPASDGMGCDTVANTDLDTTAFIATVPADDAASCCSACRAHVGCLASVLSPATKTCTLHNLTGLSARVSKVGSTACFSGPASNAAVSVPAHVPGDHLTDLQAAGLIEDPLFDNNFMNASVWGARTWTYTAIFTPPSSSLSEAAAVLLVFDGVKMGAHIVLNGKTLGTVTDQFLRYSYDVKDELLANANNTLQLVFDQDIFVNGRFMACSGARPPALRSCPIMRFACMRTPHPCPCAWVHALRPCPNMPISLGCALLTLATQQ
jgi:hypothetical protein